MALISYFPHLDAARRYSIALCLGRSSGVSIRFLDRCKSYHFARLYHATPCSLPSTGKSPHALRFLTRQVRARTRLPRALFGLRGFTGRGRRLFVDRHPGRGRGLANREAVLGLLRGLGFEAFDPELTSVRQQAVRFSAAEIVVGIAGAGMANTVFCRPGTPVIHLVPEGWEDQFYGEIATACGQGYAAVFGPGSRRTRPNTFAISRSTRRSCAKPSRRKVCGKVPGFQRDHPIWRGIGAAPRSDPTQAQRGRRNVRPAAFASLRNTPTSSTWADHAN
ncbi:hypothetical protein GCM10025880_19380 [Methylorubrum aminovorans]|uniref:glycosyltransferase family 61 protein n=1 Tax=Methylorubrum aminovorans TaxID=269069 RepID=UPI0023E995AC|nr:glycosyltransferase family 61 protein [Methylorubrum aminovorans]GMA75521.1 hypothetical protein GCM10025880_19380 [Methylorubrum aminovorans]